MSAPLYTPAELDRMTAEAEAAHMTLGAWLEHFEGLCGDHAAVLIAHPESRPVSLSRLPVDVRIITIGLLDVIDELLMERNTDPIRERIEARAAVAIALNADTPPA